MLSANRQSPAWLASPRAASESAPGTEQTGAEHGAEAEGDRAGAERAFAEPAGPAAREPRPHARRSRDGRRRAGHALRAHPPKRTRSAGRPPQTAGRPAPADAPERDVAIDLLRGLALVILVVNHIHLDSALEYATATVLSAAEILVAASGVVAGMVFGRRWRISGPRATTALLLARARKLYLATVAVIAVVGVLVAVPQIPTGAVTASPGMAPGTDLYAYDGPLRTLAAVVTLEAGPWQFSILGLFIALLVLTPPILWALDRGHWGAVLVLSLAAFLAGRSWGVDVLPSQSERAFPLLVWQALFVPGLALGYHRESIARRVGARRRQIAAAVVVAGLVALCLRLQMVGLAPVGLDRLLGYAPVDWQLWEQAHFDKTTLDVARVAVIGALAGALYLVLRRHEPGARRLLGWLLLPLGRNSFYVFIMHVFICLAVAIALAGDGIGLVGNTLVQLGCLALLWVMVRRRFLFSVVPR